jgi:uncharacterized protein (DUF1330 family)
MKNRYTFALAMAAGAVLGATSVGGLYAQGKAPGAYVIITFTDLGDRAAFKANVLDKAGPLVQKAGGRTLVATEDFTVLRQGPTPWILKRYAILGFDSVQQAKEWYASNDMRAINAYNEQQTKGRTYIVEAVKQ